MLPDQSTVLTETDEQNLSFLISGNPADPDLDPVRLRDWVSSPSISPHVQALSEVYATFADIRHASLLFSAYDAVSFALANATTPIDKLRAVETLLRLTEYGPTSPLSRRTATQAPDSLRPVSRPAVPTSHHSISPLAPLGTPNPARAQAPAVTQPAIAHPQPSIQPTKPHSANAGPLPGRAPEAPKPGAAAVQSQPVATPAPRPQPARDPAPTTIARAFAPSHADRLSAPNRARLNPAALLACAGSTTTLHAIGRAPQSAWP